jgi:membrane glycosyltransferase
MQFDDVDALAAIYRDPDLRAAHEAMLPQVAPRRRGDIELDRAMAEAKLMDAQTIDEAIVWLKPKERAVVLHDRALINVLCGLKPAAAPL